MKNHLFWRHYLINISTTQTINLNHVWPYLNLNISNFLPKHHVTIVTLIILTITSSNDLLPLREGGDCDGQSQPLAYRLKDEVMPEYCEKQLFRWPLDLFAIHPKHRRKYIPSALSEALNNRPGFLQCKTNTWLLMITL